MKRDKLDRKSDQKIIELIRQNNQSAFNQLYEKYWKTLYQYTFRILGEATVTEDVLQEVFTNIWIKRHDLDIQNLGGYLANACRNNALTKIRRARFTPLQEEVIQNLTLEPEIEAYLDLKELNQVIGDASEGLPARCREIFYMSRYQQLSNTEISEKLKISPRTVENQISRALRHIRSAINRNSAILHYSYLQLFHLIDNLF